MTGGRAEEIYRDVIPGLSELAQRTGKKLAVKLHPSENGRDRKSMAARVLGPEHSGGLEWLTRGMTPDLLRGTWFGVTVQSSVAVECAVHGVPCFLCEWLDLWPYGYIGQFRKFDIAMGLRTPSDIENIPEMLADYRANRQTVESCWKTITEQRLEQLLGGRPGESGVALEVQRERRVGVVGRAHRERRMAGQVSRTGVHGTSSLDGGRASFGQRAQGVSTRPAGGPRTGNWPYA